MKYCFSNMKFASQMVVSLCDDKKSPEFEKFGGIAYSAEGFQGGDGAEFFRGYFVTAVGVQETVEILVGF